MLWPLTASLARAQPTPDARRPTPDARRPTPDARRPTPDARNSDYLSGNALVCGDNLDILKELPDECVDLIYLDPPFQSNHDYVAVFGDKGSVDKQLRDIWRWTTQSESRYQRLPRGALRDGIDAIRLASGKTSPMAAYGLFMGLRLAEMRRVLKQTGSIYLHCDYRANWLLRILMDKVFGSQHFRNEIIWCYTGPGAAKRWFPRKHDNIFFYVKSGRSVFYADAVRRPYVATYTAARGVHGSGIGDDTARKRDIHNRGTIPTDWWADGFLTNVSAYRGELLGYPTQKPLALLKRIIEASSAKGGLVLDPFCGCGTAADAAASLGRGYLGIDVSAISVRVMEQRLASRGDAAFPAVYRMGWEDYEWDAFEERALMHESDAEDGLPGWAWAEDKVAGLLNAVPNDRKRGDGGVDARYYTDSDEVIPIQVKMHRGQIGRPDMDRLLGVQTREHSPMSLMVTLYPPRDALRVFAAQQGHIRLRGEQYPKMQVLSVEEMLTKHARPKLPPPSMTTYVGEDNTLRMALA